MIIGVMRRTPTKALEMFLDLPTLGMVVEAAALMAVYQLPRPNLTTPEIKQNRMWIQADKVESKYKTTNHHTNLRRTFGKYRITIPTREELTKK